MSSEVKWIKIAVDIFDDEKIAMIESLPDGDSIIVCWLKLLCLAGKTNNSGVMFFADKLPYTDEMLATVFRRPLQTVRLALATFEKFGMVEILNGVYTIPNWGKHQQIEGLDKVRKQTRIRVANYRERQKELSSGNVTVTHSNAVEKEEEKEKDKEIDTVLKTWNNIGISCIRSIVPNSERAKLLKARIKEHGLEAVVEAIEKISNSDFLRGQNKNGWVITFDWFIRPRNFQKVLEGNYDNRKGEKTGSGIDTRGPQDSSSGWDIHYD